MKQIRSIFLLMLALILSASMLIGCGDTQDDPIETLDSGSNTDGDETLAVPEIAINFTGTGYTVSEQGVLTASGNVLTIVKAGRYRLSGTLDNAQLCVDVEKTETVELIFAGINITNQSSAPVYIKSADKIHIELAAGTQNTLTDARTYVFPDGGDKPNACLYSSEDLTFSGNGSLTVNANYNNGIGTKNDLKIKGGNITVVAANNALKGNQSVEIKGGNLNLKGIDGIKADSALLGEGYVEISGGTVTINASDDGIQAFSRVDLLEGCIVNINANDQYVNCDYPSNINIANGTLITK